MPRRARSVALLLPLALLLSGCDLFFQGEWVEVKWTLATVNGLGPNGGSFTRELGPYVYDGQAGPVECTIEAWMMESDWWGWTEDRDTGEIEYRYPMYEDYLDTPALIFFSLSGFCGDEGTEAWRILAELASEFRIEGDDLVIGPLTVTNGYLNDHIGSDAEFAAWLTASLPERVPLAEWMYLPLELTLRHRAPDGETILAEVPLSLELGYQRRERPNGEGVTGPAY